MIPSPRTLLNVALKHPTETFTKTIMFCLYVIVFTKKIHSYLILTNYHQILNLSHVQKIVEHYATNSKATYTGQKIQLLTVTRLISHAKCTQLFTFFFNFLFRNHFYFKEQNIYEKTRNKIVMLSRRTYRGRN